MTDVRVPGDAVPPIKAVLAAHFGERMIAADELPDDFDPAASVPVIVVSDDGGPTTWPIWTEPLIRCTVYANGKQTARLLRREAMGVLLGAVPFGMHIRKTGIGYTEARDPDTGADMASFTVNATVPTEVMTV